MNNADEPITEHYYKDGSLVKENDIVFYSEDSGDHRFHYADSIGMIVKRQDDFKMKAFVITMDDAKSFQHYEEPEHNMVSLRYGCADKQNVLRDFTKIGEFPKDEKMLSAEYATSNYARKQLETTQAD